MIKKCDRDVIIECLKNIRNTLTTEDDIFDKYFSKDLPSSYFHSFVRILHTEFEKMSDFDLIMFTGYCYNNFHATSCGMTANQIKTINDFNDHVFDMIQKYKQKNI